MSIYNNIEQQNKGNYKADNYIFNLTSHYEISKQIRYYLSDLFDEFDDFDYIKQCTASHFSELLSCDNYIVSVSFPDLYSINTVLIDFYDFDDCNLKIFTALLSL